MNIDTYRGLTERLLKKFLEHGKCSKFAFSLILPQHTGIS